MSYTPSTEPDPLAPTTLGERLMLARMRAGYDNMQDFAQRLGVSRNTIPNYEKNKVRPRPIVLNAWAEATGFTVDELLGNTGEDGGPGLSLVPSDPSPGTPPGTRTQNLRIMGIGDVMTQRGHLPRAA